MKKKDQHLTQGNFLSAMLVAGSAVAGGKYAYSKFAKEYIKPTKKTTFVSPKLRFDVSDVSNSEFITELTRTLEGATLAKQAWMKAVEAVDPNSAQTLSFAGNIGELEGAAVGSAIQQTMVSNQSMYMGQIFSRFKKNVGALSQHYSVAGSLPEMMNVQAKTGMGTTLSSNQLPGRLAKPLNKIKKALGNNFAEITYHTREGWEQEGFGLYNFRFNYKGSNFDLKVPAVSGGALVEGRTQSSKRIAPAVAIFDPNSKSITRTMARDEYFMESFQKNILPGIVGGKYKNASEIRGAIKDLYATEIYSLESVPNVPVDVKKDSLTRYIGAKGQAVDIRIVGKDGFRAPSSRELADAMAAGGYVPSTSGSNLADGRVSTFNPNKWSPTPGAVDFSRSPGQAIREWAATPEAVQEMMNNGRIKFNKVFDTLERTRDLGLNPALRTMYIDPSRHKNLLQSIRLDDGESLISNRGNIQRMNEVSRVAPSMHLRQVRKDIQEIISGNKSIKSGEFIGWTTEGLPFNFKDGMKLMKFTDHSTTGRGEYGDLAIEETVSMPEHAKKFGDIKAVERMVDPRSMERTMVRKTNNDLFLANMERWASMDDLRKDKSKHNKQMLTAMWEVLSNKKDLSRKSQIFVNNPLIYSRMLEGRAEQVAGMHTDLGHKEYVKGLMKFGLKEANLSPQEFGYVFGAVPSVMGKKGVRDVYAELAMNEMSFRHLREMNKGFAGGMSQTVYNAARGPGVLGSLEPRAFELLQSGQYGDLGTDMSKDLMDRLAMSNPGTAGTYEGLTRTLSSLTGKGKATGEIWDLANRPYDQNSFQQFIQNGGGFLRANNGLPDVFVPGASDVPGMGIFKTGGGSGVKGQLAGYYHNLASGLGDLYSDTDNLSIEGANKLMEEFAFDIQKQQAPGGKGMGSLLRGRVSGSAYGTIVSEAGGQSTDSPWRIGIPEKMANRMFDDLDGVYDKAALLDMRNRFMSGEAIGGAIARHPFIGRYSVQPVEMELLRGVQEDVITIPSTNVNLNFGGENVPVNISPLVGLGADKDADIAAAFLLNPNLEKKVRNSFIAQDNEYTKAMMQHNVRMQLIKAKAKGDALGMSVEQKMIADAKKLATGQEWVGKISTELSVARQAVGAKMKGQQAADAMFLLEWLEQTPISGKHLDPKRVYDDEMATLFMQIQSSIKERNPERLRWAIEDVLRNSDDTARKLLTEGLSIKNGSQAISQLTGVDIGDTLPSIDLKNTTENVMNSLAQIEEAGMAKVARRLAGRGGKKAGQKGRLALSELGQYLEYAGRMTESGGFSSVVSNVMASKNTILSAGLDAIKNNKMKVGFGFLGALAIGASLSSPEETIGPAGGLQSETKADYKGKGSGRVDIEPPAANPQPLGAPTAPNMLRSTRSMIQPGGNSARMSIRATAGHNTNVNRIVSDIRSSNRDSNISINIRDSSAILNLHGIANKVLS